MITIIALYKFVKIDNTQTLRTVLEDICHKHTIKGTLIIAHEGINGTIAGENAAMDAFLEFFNNFLLFKNAEIKKSYAPTLPFHRMKITIKKEIVTMHVTDLNPLDAGEYIEAAAWNDVLNDPETLVIDTRNDYEVKIGSFKGAINPKTDNFAQFPDFVEKNLLPHKAKRVAMFCTGGIRCEKSTAYLKKQGFTDVVHLKGGILKYLETVDTSNSLWKGECFVFDDRTAVGHNLTPSNYVFCRSCRTPLSENDSTHKDYIEGVQCNHCAHKLTDKKRRSAAERQKQVLLAQQRNKHHFGPQIRDKHSS